MKQLGKPQKSFAEAADDGHEKEEEAIEKDMGEHRYSNLNQRIREAFPAVLQFIKFGMVGAVNTVLSYLITNGCYYLLRLHEQLSNLISFLITVLISYLLNSRFVFREKEENKQPWYLALAKVYASYAFTELVLMGILLFVQERVLGIPHYIATLVNLCVTVPLNFVLNKFWAYRKKPDGSDGMEKTGKESEEA